MLRNLLLLLSLTIAVLSADFSPETSDFDIYGVKIAANDDIFVQLQNSEQIFLVQYAPYNYTNDTLVCSLPYEESEHYMYSIAVPPRQNTSSNKIFYFIGAVTSDSSSSSGNNATFIGIAINNDTQTIMQYLTSLQPVTCEHWFFNSVIHFSSYSHQEYFVMAVEPYGQYALGFTKDFVFKYSPFSGTTINTLASSSFWPTNTTFYPCAADASETYTIVAGFSQITVRSRRRATPTVYLVLNSNLTIVSTWAYTATNGSWQSRLTYSNIGTWSKKLTMSVKINLNDPTRALVGMPFLNTAFMFLINSTQTKLSLASSLDFGNGVGFGKSVTWLAQDQAAILVSIYSKDYSSWSYSQIFLYQSFNGTTIPSSPTAVIPNAQQPLPSTMSAEWISAVSTPESLAILDIYGESMLILAEPPGYYADTNSDDSPYSPSTPIISYASICIPGTYKSARGVFPCTPCASGTRNLGTTAATSCLNCTEGSFCPLAAIHELNSSYLVATSQAVAYPRSPELDVFEDILLTNMFSLGGDGRCLRVSPVFWVFMLVAIMGLFLIGVASMSLWLEAEKRETWQGKIKEFFERADLIGEGEMWLGGIVSLAIIMVTGMAYGFAISYMHQYPSEKVGPSEFACDTTLRNAKFQSSLQALAVPISDAEQPIFNMLLQQNFTMSVELLNTVLICGSVTVNQVKDSSSIALSKSCSVANGVLSLSIPLPEHLLTIALILDDIEPIGGIRLGLSGPSQTNGLNNLQQLDFREVLQDGSKSTLAQSGTIYLALTKAINETEPLSGTDSEFSAIWYPTFTYSQEELFIGSASYLVSANQASTTIYIQITETTYYIKNVQSPIAKRSEIIFRTLLFASLCLEICGLTFLVFKLVIIPIVNKIWKLLSRRVNQVYPFRPREQRA